MLIVTLVMFMRFENRTKQITALKKAINIAGSQAKLGKMLNKPQAVICSWLTRYRIDPTMIIKIETHTGVSRFELDPEIYPKEEQVGLTKMVIQDQR